jgi:hypothetical protein
MEQPRAATVGYAGNTFSDHQGSKAMHATDTLYSQYGLASDDRSMKYRVHVLSFRWSFYGHL